MTKKQRYKKETVHIACMLACMISMAACSGPTNESITPEPTESPNEIYINLDCKDSSLPTRFRKCDDSIDNKIGDKTISLEGLADLMASGSGQFSQEGLALVQQEIGEIPIVIIDLREESHGFVNGIALSWMDKDNKANKGLTMDQVADDENAKLEALEDEGVVTFPTDGNSRVNIDNVQSEEQLATGLGMSYLRLPVTNNERPSDEVTDAFIRFVLSQPQGVWLHFHCMEGVGRTTVFMVLYDAMKNAKTVSLEDIMDRQVLLGGKNLLHSGSDERAAFIRSFYQYCVENDDGYQTPYSKWVLNGL